MVMALEEKKNG